MTPDSAPLRQRLAAACRPNAACARRHRRPPNRARTASRPRRRNEPARRQTPRRRAIAGRVVRGRRAGRLAAAPRRRKTIGELSARPVVVQPDQKVEASATRAMENYRRFLELQKTGSAAAREALRRLADLNMEAGEGDRMAGEASLIDAQGAEAIKLYTSLLKSYPDYPRNDQVLYQLRARLRDHRPARKGAGDARRHHAPLSAARRRWTRCSSAAASCCSPPSSTSPRRMRTVSWSARATSRRFLTQSLYKHGWSLFKQGLNDDSLPSFAGVLDRTMLHEADAHADSGREAAARQPRAGRRHAACHGRHVLV